MVHKHEVKSQKTSVSSITGKAAEEEELMI